MKRADQRKFHYLYKITRFDGKYYFGIHSTDNLEDGYFGSGTYLWKSLNRHGKEKHSKEILEFFDTRQASKDKEKLLITDEMRADTKCMNIAPGGGGGFKNEEHQKKCAEAAIQSLKQKRKNPEYKAKHTKLLSERAQQMHLEGKMYVFKNAINPWRKDHKHSDSTLIQMKISQNAVDRNGDKNPMFGKKLAWISKLGEVKRIPLEKLNHYLNDDWVRGIKR